jgi:acetylornithine deacetylase/succinyl-diaminopimelate desuccinylase-like protein
MNAPDRLPGLDATLLSRFVEDAWDTRVVPELSDYIQIPAKSPMFDADWAAHGYIETVVRRAATWVEAQRLTGLRLEVVRLAEPDGTPRTPVIFFELPATMPGGNAASAPTVLLYGHLDKQPEFSGWRADLGPWTPKYEGGLLYGRGGADDGYALFASLTAIRGLHQQGIGHARCVALIEASEESGSPDLVHHIDALGARLGSPTLVVCLDAECGNYEQLWCTTSLRGNLIGSLRVDVLTEGVHSGTASGVVPSSFRILRELLARVEDAGSGTILIEELNAPIPPDRRVQAKAAAAVLGDTVFAKFPLMPGMRPMSNDPFELLLNNNWRPTLSITGAEGLPAFRSAGNVLRPHTTLKLSFRLPPTLSPAAAASAIERTLASDPPYGARVSFAVESAMGGWNAPTLAPWLEQSMQAASQAFFGRDAMYMGTGGSIPFMGMLGERFPATQFLVTGVLGPQSNAHGPNEFLHLETARRLTACVARVLADHAAHGQRAAA